MKKTLGIIGGLGPAASNLFCSLIMNPRASCDQEHIDYVLYSRASTPDRTAFLTGRSDESPLPAILDTVRKLNGTGADYIAMPCMTAHCFMDEIREASKVPVISMIEETVAHLQEHGYKSAVILATDGTVKSGVLQTALESAGIAALLPEPQQQTRVMEAINAVKSGQASTLELALNAQVALLACTELSIADCRLSVEKADCMEILARKAISLCSQI
jgi:aspartate racemase